MKLTITGFDELIAKLESVNDLIASINEAIREQVEEAETIVLTKYSIQGNGNTDFTTSVEPIENGWRLIASGEDVGFLEFGAGVFAGIEPDVFTQDVDYPVEPGSWSKIHEHSSNPNARYFAKNGFWWWSGFRYTGLYPTRGMQEALDHIRDNILRAIEQRIDEWIAK